MTVENVKNAIQQEAQRNADRIKQAGQKRADEKYRQAEERLQGEFDQRVTDAREHHQAEKNRATISVRADLSMKLLRAKNEVIDKIFDQAVEQTINLPSDGYKKLLLQWLKDSAPETEAELVLNKADKDAFGQALVDEMNKNRGKDAQMTLAKKSGHIRGGFLLRTFKYEIDRTFDSIVANLKVEMAPEVASELFGGRIERL